MARPHRAVVLLGVLLLAATLSFGAGFRAHGARHRPVLPHGSMQQAEFPSKAEQRQGMGGQPVPSTGDAALGRDVEAEGPTATTRRDSVPYYDTLPFARRLPPLAPGHPDAACMATAMQRHGAAMARSVSALQAIEVKGDNEQVGDGIDTVDDVARAEHMAQRPPPKHSLPSDAAALRTVGMCDPFHVPFDPRRWTVCAALIADSTVWAGLEALPPKFEQRTIKFTAYVVDPWSGARHAVLVKVPQSIFPDEPYNEVAAAAVDRVLGMHRVPPTALANVSIAGLVAVARRDTAHVKTVKQFAEGRDGFAAWVERDFAAFVRHRRGPAMAADDRVLVSVQLLVSGVRPLLSSRVKTPYNKATNPGWHRWFNPAWPGFGPLWKQGRAQMLGMSEQALLDYVLLNHDRSPNKNSFIADGCWAGRCPDPPTAPPPDVFARHASDASHTGRALQAKGHAHHMGGHRHGKKGHPHHGAADEGHAAVSAPPREVRAATTWDLPRPSYLVATFLHLDQGMAFRGYDIANPVGKPRNNTYCAFPLPVVDHARCLLQRHLPVGPAVAATYTDARLAEAALAAGVGHRLARRVLAEAPAAYKGLAEITTLSRAMSQVARLVAKAAKCVDAFGARTALQP